MPPPATSIAPRGRRVAELLRHWTNRELRSRYRRGVLRFGWSLITPVVLLVVYGVVLTQGADVRFDDDLPYLSAAWAGLVVWTFFSGCLSSGSTSILGAREMVAKIAFPREVIPLSSVAVTIVESAPAVALLAALALVQIGAAVISPALIALLPAIACLLLWSTALAVGVAVAAVFVRDVVFLARIVVQVGFFATPVMYPPSFLGDLRWLAVLNPFAVVIEAVRDSLLRGQWPDAGLLGVHSVVGGLALIGVLLVTRRVELQIADVL